MMEANIYVGVKYMQAEGESLAIYVNLTLKYTIRQTSAIRSGNSMIFSLHFSKVHATSKHFVTFVMIW